MRRTETKRESGIIQSVAWGKDYFGVSVKDRNLDYNQKHGKLALFRHLSTNKFDIKERKKGNP